MSFLMDRSQSIQQELVDFLGKVFPGEPESVYESGIQRAVEQTAVLDMGNQFFYLFNLKDSANFYVSPNIQRVLGYSPAEVNLVKIYNLIHPDDFEQVLDLTRRMIEIGYKRIPPKPLHDVFSCDYRMQNASGKYLKVSRSIALFDHNPQTDESIIIGTLTDISHLRVGDSIHFTYTGQKEQEIIELLRSVYRVDFTPREVEILHYISKGYSSKEIAHQLHISFFTVNTHRRNMLQKIKGRNVADLINYAMEQGII